MAISEDMDWTEISIAVFERWGFENVPEAGGWKTIRCVFHGDRQASGRINVREGAYACMACPKKGDLFKLVMEEERVDFAGAKHFIERIAGKQITPLSGKPSGKSGPRIPSGGKADYERGHGPLSAGLHRKRPGGGRPR